ncbi:MAG: hypothetical protein ACM3SY_18355 [Candidatus Omnitrophota bacterium]
MSPEEIREQIEFELEEIESLFELYKEELRNQERKPDLFKRTAYGGILHSFYNGIERIFLIIAKNIDKKIPTDSSWHKSLLLEMVKENQYRPAVLSEKLKDRLLDYLGFRHFFRHSYSIHLEWEEMEDLISSLRSVWIKFKVEILVFMDNFLK